VIYLLVLCDFFLDFFDFLALRSCFFFDFLCFFLARSSSLELLPEDESFRVLGLGDRFRFFSSVKERFDLALLPFECSGDGDLEDEHELEDE